MVHSISIKILLPCHKAYHRLKVFFYFSFCEACQVLYKLSLTVVHSVDESKFVHNEVVPDFSGFF